MVLLFYFSISFSSLLRKGTRWKKFSSLFVWKCFYPTLNTIAWQVRISRWESVSPQDCEGIALLSSSFPSYCWSLKQFRFLTVCVWFVYRSSFVWSSVSWKLKVLCPFLKTWWLLIWENLELVLWWFPFLSFYFRYFCYLDVGHPRLVL